MHDHADEDHDVYGLLLKMAAEIAEIKVRVERLQEHSEAHSTNLYAVRSDVVRIGQDVAVLVTKVNDHSQKIIKLEDSSIVSGRMLSAWQGAKSFGAWALSIVIAFVALAVSVYNKH